MSKVKKVGGSSNCNTTWGIEKGNNFIDQVVKKKAFVPAPDKYGNLVEGAAYLSKRSNSYSLYKSPRKTELNQIVSKAEKVNHIGPGTHNPKTV